MAQKRAKSPEREAYQQALAKLIGGPTVAYRPYLARVVGGVKAAVMLSQLLYWNGDPDVKKRDGNWILKSVEEMEEETGLTQTEQATARKTLKEYGLIECALKGWPRIWFYRVDMDRLGDLLIDPQTHSTANSLNENRIQRKGHSTKMRRNIERQSDGTFIHKVPQLNNELKTTESRLHDSEITSSSSDDIDGSQVENVEEEEDVSTVLYSDEFIEELRAIGVFEDKIPFVLKSGISEQGLQDLIDECALVEPRMGKLAGLFLYRLEQKLKTPPPPPTIQQVQPNDESTAEPEPQPEPQQPVIDTEAARVWLMVSSQLEMQMSRGPFESWVKPLQPVALRQSGESMVLHLAAVNNYSRDWVESRLGKTIRNLLTSIIGLPIDLEITAP